MRISPRACRRACRWRSTNFSGRSFLPMFDVMVRKACIGVATLVWLAAFTPASAGAKMQSVELGKKVCQTTGGGKIVDIPGFPGERIDRRLLRDIKFLRRKYEVFITDGYSTDPVHSSNGEHPRGVALDIVPNFAAGGDWNDIDRLARWAEPSQNQPRSPYRWVGYNGDAHHGRGHHLHLSYSHSGAPFGKTPKTVYTVKCPRSRTDAEPGDGGDDDTGGGVTPRALGPIELAPVAPETGGAGLSAAG
jgi:hypothetical protein